MKIYKNPFGAALLLVGGLLSTNAGATPTIETFNNVPLTAIAGGFTSGEIALPALPDFTPTLVFGDGFNNPAQPLQLDLNLAQTFTLTDSITGFGYGFGMGNFWPYLDYNDGTNQYTNSDGFTFSIELLNNGTLVTPDFAFDTSHPYTSFGGVDVAFPNLSNIAGVGFGTSAQSILEGGILPSSLTFNQIEILVTNSNPVDPAYNPQGGEAAGRFSVTLYADKSGPVTDPVAGVPDGGMTVAMLGSALAGLAMLRRRFAKSGHSQSASLARPTRRAICWIRPGGLICWMGASHRDRGEECIPYEGSPFHGQRNRLPDDFAGVVAIG